MERSANSLGIALVGSMLASTAQASALGDAAADGALRLLGNLVFTAPLLGIAALGLWAGAAARKATREAILREVVSPPAPAPPHARPPPAATPRTASVALQPVAKLPTPPEHVQARLLAITARGPLLWRAYAGTAFALAAACVGLRFAAGVLPGGDRLGPASLWIPLVWLFMAPFFLLRGEGSSQGALGALQLLARLALHTAAHLGDERSRREPFAALTPLAPVKPPLYGLSWACLCVWEASELAGTVGFLPAAGMATIPGIASFLLHHHLANLERRFPIHPPVALVLLRVFDNPDPARLLRLIDPWYWLGPLYKLDGPDTAGEKGAAVAAWMTGQLDRMIVQDEAELEQAVQTFDTRRDRQLQFACNALQCTDSTWQAAIHAMLGRADLVVMDLSGFRDKHRGCAYELQTLVRDLPFDRFRLLVDDATDLPALTALLGPLLPDDAPALPLLHVRGDDDALRLVGHLCALACPGPTVPLHGSWTRPGLVPAGPVDP